MISLVLESSEIAQTCQKVEKIGNSSQILEIRHKIVSKGRNFSFEFRVDSLEQFEV